MICLEMEYPVRSKERLVIPVTAAKISRAFQSMLCLVNVKDWKSCKYPNDGWIFRVKGFYTPFFTMEIRRNVSINLFSIWFETQRPWISIPVFNEKKVKVVQEEF